MESSEKISVIVPIYKVEAYLPKCVDSIRNQTYRNLEIILVDDGSPDGCGALCEEYARADSRIQVIHKPNGGLSSARNAGLDIASGDWIAFVDSDDWIEPDTYEAMLSSAKRHEVPLVCAGRYDVDEQTMERTRGLCPEREETVSGEEMVSRIFRWNQMDSSVCDKLFAAHLWKEIRFPQGKVVEDVPTTYRIVLLAGKAVLLPKPVYNYLCRANSITTAAMTEKNFHFYYHTEKIYADICANYPNLEPEARYLRVRALIYTIETLDLADKEAAAKFASIHRDAREELKRNAAFLQKSPFFGIKERVEGILLPYGLYWKLQRVYHFLKYRE